MSCSFLAHFGTHQKNNIQKSPLSLPFSAWSKRIIKSIGINWQWLHTVRVHPWKPLKRYYFNRKCIFQPLIFRGHSFVFRGVLLQYLWKKPSGLTNWSDKRLGRFVDFVQLESDLHFKTINAWYWCIYTKNLHGCYLFKFVYILWFFVPWEDLDFFMISWHLASRFFK